MTTETQVAFQGTETQRELAARAFDVMKRKGMMFGANAPIRMPLRNIADALAKAGGPMAGANVDALISDLRDALLLNSDRFGHEANDEFVTTKSGRAPHTNNGQNVHTFKERLNTGATSLDAEKAKKYEEAIVDLTTSRFEKTLMLEDEEDEEDYAPPPPSRIQTAPQPVPRIFENSIIIAADQIPESYRPLVPEPKEEAQVEAPVPPQRTQETPAATAPIAPTQVAQPAQTPAAQTAPPAATTRPAEEEQAARRPAAAATPTTPTPATTTTPATSQPRVVPTAPPAKQPKAEPQTTPALVTPIAPTAPASPPTTSTPQAQVAQPVPVAETQAPVAPKRPQAPVTPAAPAAPVFTGPVEVTFATESGPVTVDLREEVDIILLDDAVADALERMVENTIANDARMVRFGSEMLPEEAVQRFSKGDFRRIKEYLDEPDTGGLASDKDITTDVLNRRADFPDYERLRFSVNYRMLKEKKEFEFVGVDSGRLWISAGASPVSLPARKPAEIGQDYRFLEDPAIASDDDEGAAAGQAAGPIHYSLTYYEYENGVLPYDSRLKRIFPGAVFEDQRSSLISFEIPQLYAAVVGELRYPSGNRGGFIMGLRDLFVEHMVPGGKFSIVPTDRAENIFEVHFNRADEVEVNLLQFDDRKSRYLFRPVSFAIETDQAMLPTQERFGKLHNQKNLEESERKRPDAVIANAFELVGEQNDGKLWATFDDLYAAVNIERPISRQWLRTLLSGTYPAFSLDETTEDAYFYEA